MSTIVLKFSAVEPNEDWGKRTHCEFSETAVLPTYSAKVTFLRWIKLKYLNGDYPIRPRLHACDYNQRRTETQAHEVISSFRCVGLLENTGASKTQGSPRWSYVNRAAVLKTHMTERCCCLCCSWYANTSTLTLAHSHTAGRMVSCSVGSIRPVVGEHSDDGEA